MAEKSLSGSEIDATIGQIDRRVKYGPEPLFRPALLVSSLPSMDSIGRWLAKGGTSGHDDVLDFWLAFRGLLV